MHCEELRSPHLLAPGWPMLEQAPLMDREAVPQSNQASVLARTGPQSPRRAPLFPGRAQGSRCIPPTLRSRDPHTPPAACEGAGRQHAAYMERMGATSSREAIRIPISQMQAVSSRAHVGSPLALPWPKTWKWGGEGRVRLRSAL